eukprot:scaffold3820_cov77-Skeletonema_dohrnii-CCMP3373.AAC.3
MPSTGRSCPKTSTCALLPLALRFPKLTFYSAIVNDVYLSQHHSVGYHDNGSQQRQQQQQLSHLIQPPTSRGNDGYGRYDNGSGAAPQETFTIDAPKGKLGVDSSPIADRIQVGDKLIAVDEEDVTSMSAIQVSKLLARKSEQNVRKLTIVRTVRGRGVINHDDDFNGKEMTMVS